MKRNAPAKYVLLGTAMLLPLLISCGTGSLNQPVQTQQGLISGVLLENSNVTVFKGIPYAAPPVGDLRWREPQPPIPWEGVRIADEFCESCIQTLSRSRPPWTEEFMVQDTISEDCLFLNIWTPAKKATDNLPVLVYMHGGGFTEGSGSIAVYDGEELAKKGIIVVTINYRLGLLGFFTHPELSAESPNHVSGNYGLLDMVAALQWIQDNIAAFGGDPERVTIAGQSAGAMGVHALIASPQAAGLFGGAIAESGTSFAPGRASTRLNDAEEAGVRFAEMKGATGIADLRAMSVEQLLAPVEGAMLPRFSTIVDGWFLPDDILKIIAEGRQNDVAVIVGGNADEGSSSPAYGKTTLQQLTEQAERIYGDRATEYLGLYHATTDEDAGLVSKEASRDQSRVSLFLWADYRAKTARTPAYTYFFSRGIPWPEHPEFAAFHTGEVPYVFNNLKMLDRPWEAVDTMVADVMSSYWANFVATGNPNGPALPEWPAFDSNNQATMQIGEDIEPIPVASDDAFVFYRDAILGTE